jgi:signal transduction histidine kinase
LRYHHPERKPEIVIRKFSTAKQDVIEVADNGLGIDLNRYQQSIFRMRESAHDHPESSGIGLALIKEQIESLGGSIEVESEVGKGSVFRVFFQKT